MIQQKLKICSSCGDPCKLWRSSPPLCKDCTGRIKSVEQRSQVTLTQTTSGKLARPIKAISNKRAEALKKYRRLRDKYFEDHPACEFPGCNSRKITLHHKKGRQGALLTDKRNFCSLCMAHHRFVEENPQEAQRLGLSIKRLTT